MEIPTAMMKRNNRRNAHPKKNETISKPLLSSGMLKLYVCPPQGT